MLLHQGKIEAMGTDAELQVQSATYRKMLENCLLYTSFSQLTRDYGDKESKVIQNTIGNVFSGQVVGETAKTLSERFGKVLQQRQSMTINRNDKSLSLIHI